MEVSTPKDTAFKKCTFCEFLWNSRDKFLADSNVTMVGYQAGFSDLSAGLFLFNHKCKTTLAIKAGDFRDLYDGPVYSNRVTGTEDCPRYCLVENELRACPNKCECSYVREILQVVKSWPKSR